MSKYIYNYVLDVIYVQEANIHNCCFEIAFAAPSLDKNIGTSFKLHAQKLKLG